MGICWWHTITGPAWQKRGVTAASIPQQPRDKAACGLLRACMAGRTAPRSGPVSGIMTARMKRLTRYLARMFVTDALILFGVVCFLLWLVNCLRSFDVVSVKGQSIWVLAV